MEILTGFVETLALTEPPMALSKEERFYSGKAFGKVTVRNGESIHALEPWPESSRQERRPFTWGRDPSGASQLALALLWDVLNDEAAATRFHQHFSRRVVAILPDRWTISRTRIIAHVNMIKYQSTLNLTDFRVSRFG